MEEYSVALCKLYKWLLLAIEVRIEDVKMLVAKGALKADLEENSKGVDDQIQDINQNLKVMDGDIVVIQRAMN